MINEVAREMNLRSSTFPRLITGGRLSEGEATERTERLQAVLKFLITVKNLKFHRVDEAVDALRVHRSIIDTPAAVSTPINIKGCE